MNLPAGKACGMCYLYRKCTSFGIVDSPDRDNCDFFPREFREVGEGAMNRDEMIERAAALRQEAGEYRKNAEDYARMAEDLEDEAERLESEIGERILAEGEEI